MSLGFIESKALMESYLILHVVGFQCTEGLSVVTISPHFIHNWISVYWSLKYCLTWPCVVLVFNMLKICVVTILPAVALTQFHSYLPLYGVGFQGTEYHGQYITFDLLLRRLAQQDVQLLQEINCCLEIRSEVKFSVPVYQPIDMVPEAGYGAYNWLHQLSTELM